MQVSISSAEALGAVMRARRQADGLTQSEIAASTGMSKFNIRRLENGRDNKITMLLRWARSMGVSIVLDDPRLQENDQ